MARKRSTAEEATLLETIRQRFTYAQNEWREIREEAQTDMRYVAGDPWNPKDRKAREDSGRPCLSLDELGQYINQIVNEVRANKRAIRVTPTGAGANDATAELHADLMRQIEYRSHAQEAYTTAFENAVSRSYGYFRVNTRYLPESFDQELVIEPMVNPDMVLPDPDAKKSTFSDMRWCFVYEDWRVEEFRKRFPKADVHDFGPDTQAQAPSWVSEDKVRLAEYWTIESRERELLLVDGPDGPTAVYADEVTGTPPKVLRSRLCEEPQVVQYLTNGVEILKETPWAGQFIPIIACVGKVLYVDEGAGSKRKLMSLTRLARDPYMLYCYYRTCEAELVGMTPKTPFIGYEGQFREHEVEWQKAAHEPVAFLEANPLTEGTGQNILPLPQRQPYDPPIQALEVGAESARRAIQASMGTSPLPTNAQRQNEKSGIALRQIESTSQRGSYHFIDHYEDAIRQCGVVLEDLIPKIYDTARDVGVRKPDDTAKVVRINDPQAEPSTQGEPPLPPMDQGDHDITISTGPSFESERQAASDFADTLAQNPQVFPLIAPLVVKLKNLGPIGDQIAKDLEVLQPPELRKPQDGQQAIPPEVQQMLQQANQMAEAAKQEIAQLQQQLQTESVKAQADTQRAAASDAVKLKIAALDAQTKIQIEQMRLDAEHVLEVFKAQQANENREDEQKHEVSLKAADAAHAHEQAEAAHARMLSLPQESEAESAN